jgi:hypothetical protein
MTPFHAQEKAQVTTLLPFSPLSTPLTHFSSKSPTPTHAFIPTSFIKQSSFGHKKTALGGR